MKIFPLLIHLVIAVKIAWAAVGGAGAGAGAININSASCPASGFAGCECRIYGGCDNLGNIDHAAQANMRNFTPQGMDQFAYRPNGSADLGTICESDSVAILYDCNARIPLYTATVMYGSQSKARYSRPSTTWRQTTDPRLQLHGDLIAMDRDYVGSLNHVACYKDNATGQSYDWDTNGPPCQGKKFTIHKGHMIASGYGRGYPTMSDATFTYTNAVPQAGRMNSGAWRSAEQKLVSTYNRDCQNIHPSNEDARIFIVVGVIPSTFAGLPRFFGASGFSNAQDNTNHRLVVPYIMWTASCCTYTNSTHSIVKTHAFWRKNEPKRYPVTTHNTPTEMFQAIRIRNPTMLNFTDPVLFPQEPRCMTGTIAG